MTTLLTSQDMAIWPPARTRDSSYPGRALEETQDSADEEVYDSRAQISRNASIRNPGTLRSLITALFMLVAFTLPLVFSPVYVQDVVGVSVQTFSNQLRAHTGNYAPGISNSERLYESLERGVETAGSLSWAPDDASAWPSLEFRGLADVETTTNSLWAFGHVRAPVWLEAPPLAAIPSFTNEFKLSNRYDSLDSDYDDPEEKMEVTAPTAKIETHLARVTAYWPGEGADYTARGLSSSGVQLRDGHCAVDPKVIPYGSMVKIAGVGEYVAVDTGPAVVSRRAARQAGRTSRERNALVVDVYCSSRSKARVFEANAPDFAVINVVPVGPQARFKKSRLAANGALSRVAF
jgi:3D (Asp-Asp-Asp) domain-containing protein